MGAQIEENHPIARDVVLELVRTEVRPDAPSTSLSRVRARIAELLGEGPRVLMIYPSANRDAEAFDSPDVLDIDRQPQHLAFGLGNHFGLGANLARMELRVGLQFSRRVPQCLPILRHRRTYNLQVAFELVRCEQQ